MNIAYVVTSSGEDLFSDMALVSMVSARLSNPETQLLLLCDRDTARASHAARHQMLDVCDRLISVDSPSGAPVFINRWIKTTATRWIDEPFLLLDTDTLVRRDLGEAFSLVKDLGAIPNHNAELYERPIWHEDLQELIRMDWPQTFTSYWNGGALFCRQTEKVHEMFELWHELYLKSAETMHRYRDQPSLNTAVEWSSIGITRMPDTYNFQIKDICKGWSDAAIWHFYSSEGLRDTLFGEIVASVRTLAAHELELHVRRAIEAAHPFLASDSVALSISEEANATGCLTPGEKAWLKTGSTQDRLQLLRSNVIPQDRLEALIAENGQLRARLSDLRSSSSWRLTAPYRTIGRLLNSLLSPGNG